MNYGVVAEFNPFHKGHRYFCDTVKGEGDTLTAVMSENFVQRGECAVMSGTARAQSAVKNGVDLVLSLPLRFAVSSAEMFAFGAVSALENAGFIDCLVFGSECGDTRLLEECADALLNENFTPFLQEELAKGLSFPKARQEALTKFVGKRASAVITNPNDTLAVEYIKAIKILGSKMSFRAIKRVGALHDEFAEDCELKSGSEIREKIKDGTYCDFVPVETAEIVERELKENRCPCSLENTESAMLYALRLKSKEALSRLPDVSEGLQNRLYEAIRSESDVNSLLEKCKTKRYTLSRLRRILLCGFLGIEKSELKTLPYVRVLAIGKNGEKLLKTAKKKACVPLLTNYSQVAELTPNGKDMYYLESRGRDLLSLCMPKPDGCGKLMTDKIPIVKE